MSAFRAVVMGYYGAGNVGDELLCSLVCGWLEELGGSVAIVTLDPDYTARVHGGRRTVGFYDAVALAREIGDSDLFVLGGGGVFHDYQAGLSIGQLFRYPSFNMAQYVQNILIARQLQVPVMFFAQGLGPLRHDDARMLMRELFQAVPYLTLRDQTSKEVMLSLGVERDVVVAPDPIFAWPIEHDRGAKETSDYRIGLVVRDWPFAAGWKSKIEACIDWMSAHPQVSFRFIDFAGGQDRLVIDALTARLSPDRFEVVTSSEDPLRAASAFEGLKGVVVMRLHAQILAARLGLPLVCIEYDQKLSSVSEMTGIASAGRIQLDDDIERYVAACEILSTESLRHTLCADRSLVEELDRSAKSHRSMLAEVVADLGRGEKPKTLSLNSDWLSRWFRDVGVPMPERPIDALVELRRQLNNAQAATKALESELNDKRASVDKLPEALRQLDDRKAELGRLLEVRDAALRQLDDRQAEVERLAETKEAALRQLDHQQAEINRLELLVARETKLKAAQDKKIREQSELLVSQQLELQRVTQERDAKERERNNWEYRARALQSSTSWKVTAALRMVGEAGRLGRDYKRVGQRVSHLADLRRRSGIGGVASWLVGRLTTGSPPGGLRNNVEPHAPPAQAVDLTGGILNKVEFLSMLRAEQRKGRLVFAEMPIIDWSVPLFQRPQHIATAIARQGALVVYTTSNQYDNVHGYQQVYPGVWLTNDGSVYDEIEGAIVSIYSTAHFDNYPLLDRVRAKNALLYEYIDHIDEAISGDGVPKLLKLKNYCFGGAADCIVASAEQLRLEAVDAVGEERVALAPNGVDYGHYAKALAAETSPPPDIQAFCKKYPKIVGYFGALAPWIWYEMLNELTETRPDVGFILIGPDYYGGMDNVARRENVLLTGAIPYTNLPAYAKTFDVAIIPFRHGEIAWTTSPLKLFEYFALEKPVVVTDQMKECIVYPEVFRAPDAAGFAMAIDQAFKVSSSLEFKSKLRELALQNTWDARAKTMLRAGQGVLQSKRFS